MDQKARLWRKKCSDKTIFATNKVDNRLSGTEEVPKNPVENGVESEISAKTLNEKLASVLLDCPVKEDLVTKGDEETVANVPISQEKANKEKTVFVKQELDEALKRREFGRESLVDSDLELEECRKQLSIVQEEQEKKIQEAVMMASTENEKAQKKLEEKYAEASKQIADLSVENSNMARAFLVKERLMEDLNRRKSRAEAESGALVTRLDSTEKENAFLKHEFDVIARELRIRNEEMEYYRRSADALQKQYFESTQKLTSLEQECQWLHVPARKRLNGPPGNMRNEVQSKGRNQTELRRRKPNPSRDLVVRDSIMESSPESMNKDMNLMVERLRMVEQENQVLKNVLSRKIPELQFSKSGFDMQLVRRNHMANKPSMLSDFDVGSEDAISSSGSWANALISESEHIKKGQHRDFPNRKPADISLMDDFVEMEKLAIVSADKPSGNGQQQDIANGKPFDWLQVVLSAMLEQKHVSKRSLQELLEDIKIALGFINSPVTPEASKTAKCWIPKEADPLPISGYLTWNSPKGSPIMNSSSGTGATSIDTSPKEDGIQCSLSESIGKIIELIRSINPSSFAGDHTSEQNQKLAPAISADYFIRVFQWRNSELNAVLQRFIHTCNDLLSERSNLERFVEEVASTLDWILNNYVTPKEAANARDKIKKHFGWNEPEREKDQGLSLTNGESGTVSSEVQPSGWPLLASRENQDALIPSENSQCTLQEEISRLKDELKSVMSEKADMEVTLNSATEKNEGLLIHLHESQQTVGSLQAELYAMKETKGTIEDQIENEKLISDDLDTQLTVARAKLNEVFQKVSSLEVELDDKRNCCEELEATCLELELQLQLKLESDAASYTPKHETGIEETKSQSGLEIKTASEKLAECQETIFNLGKQLKALAAPREEAVLDNVFCNKGKNLNKGSSLRDRMMYEDGTKAEALGARKVEETMNSQSNGHNAVDSPDVIPPVVASCRSSSCRPGNGAVGAMAIVPSKKKGGGFDLLRKLLLRRKRRYGQKSR